MFYDRSFKQPTEIISLQKLYQSKLSFGKGRYTGEDKETERRRKRECDGDERGRAGIAHCAQGEIIIITMDSYLTQIYVLR